MRIYLSTKNKNGYTLKPTQKKNGKIRELKEYKNNNLSIYELIDLRAKERQERKRIIYLIKKENNKWTLGTIEKSGIDIGKDKDLHFKRITSRARQTRIANKQERTNYNHSFEQRVLVDGGC